MNNKMAINTYLSISESKKQSKQLWLVWLSGLSAGLWTKGSQVLFPVRAHVWVPGSVPVELVQEATDQCFSLTSMFLSLSLSPSFLLPLNSIVMSLGDDKKNLHWDGIPLGMCFMRHHLTARVRILVTERSILALFQDWASGGSGQVFIGALKLWAWSWGSFSSPTLPPLAGLFWTR